jgi:putative hydrolase of HD superfamily
MSIDRGVAFALELDRLKSVPRRIRLRESARHENPAEHSWQTALLAVALAPYAGAPVDVARVIQMLLVHDVGEIDVGDQLAFLPTSAERARAERAGAARVFDLLPAAPAASLFALWDEFEAAETVDARFAQALDRAIPVILNLANGGQSWRENGVSYDRLVAHVRPPVERGCPQLWWYLESRLEAARENGFFG